MQNMNYIYDHMTTSFSDPAGLRADVAVVHLAASGDCLAEPTNRREKGAAGGRVAPAGGVRRWAFLVPLVGMLAAGHVAAREFEVWLVDQSNSPGKSYGGAIYIYNGADLMGDRAAEAKPAEVIDLGGEVAALCLAQTGANPVRPHMITFNSTDTHAALAFVVSGHVVILDGKSRRPLASFRMAAGAGGARQAHAAWPTPDDRYLLVANQNGKRFERIATDYWNDQYVYEPEAAVDLANGTTPNGFPRQDPVLRPDNAPICPFVASDGGPALVSLRGGGLFAVDWRATPMEIVAEYDRGVIGANGCGFIEAGGWIYLNAGGGTPANLDQFTIYRLPMGGYSPAEPPNTPAPELIFSDDAEHRDAHGVASSKGGRYVWMFDRAANAAEIFEAASGERINRVDLISDESDDPTPDLVVAAPSGNRLFVCLRGPNPLSGDPHASTGSTPGLGVIQIEANGRSGHLKRVLRITNPDAAGIERADPHGIELRLK